MEFKIEYVPHNRSVPESQVQDYGQLATHDMRIPLLLLYEVGRIRDKDGKEANITKDRLEELRDLTNERMEARKQNPLSKFISKWRKTIDEAPNIPIIKDHDVDTVDKKIGQIEGKIFMEEVEGKPCLFGNAVIFDLQGKLDIQAGKLREGSIGTRGDGSIREVSMVTNEAAPLCGLMFSEPAFDVKKKKSKITKSITKSKISKESKEPVIKLSEQEIKLSELRFEESELENKTIPNHMIICKMIKNGKLKPYKYDECIKMDTSTLQFMESSMPTTDLGLMFGTNKQPQTIKSEDFKFDQLMAEAKQKLGIANDSPKQFDMIRQDFNFEEYRTKELKRMLELAEGSPELVKQYIKYELGEEVESPSYEDKDLEGYMLRLSEIKSQIKSFKFGEK